MAIDYTKLGEKYKGYYWFTNDYINSLSKFGTINNMVNFVKLQRQIIKNPDLLLTVESHIRKLVNVARSVNTANSETDIVNKYRPMAHEIINKSLQILDRTLYLDKEGKKHLPKLQGDYNYIIELTTKNILYLDVGVNEKLYPITYKVKPSFKPITFTANTDITKSNLDSLIQTFESAENDARKCIEVLDKKGKEVSDLINNITTELNSMVKSIETDYVRRLKGNNQMLILARAKIKSLNEITIAIQKLIGSMLLTGILGKVKTSMDILNSGLYEIVKYSLDSKK